MSEARECLVKETGGLVNDLVNDTISRQAAIRLVHSVLYEMMVDAAATDIEKPMSKEDKLLLRVNKVVCAKLKELPPVQRDDAALHESCIDCPLYDHDRHSCPRFNKVIPTAIRDALERLPSAEPEQRYTEEELRVFAHGISLSLLSKRSAQHWRYDKDTATEIEFLERLYEKVGADMRGEEDGWEHQKV